jgi:hypothetical protein
MKRAPSTNLCKKGKMWSHVKVHTIDRLSRIFKVKKFSMGRRIRKQEGKEKFVSLCAQTGDAEINDKVIEY